MKDGPLVPREAQKRGLQKPGVRRYVHTAGSKFFGSGVHQCAELGLPAENLVS